MRTVERISLLLLLTACLCGCEAGRWLAYVFAPVASRETVEAEFNELAGKRVAVIVFTDDATQVDYPLARLTISQKVDEALRANVKGIQTLGADRVIQYQEENIRWDEYDKTRICRDLDVDYLLYLSVLEFSTLESGSMSLYRGRITVEPKVYDAAMQEHTACVWKGEAIRVVYPENAPGRIENAGVVRHGAEMALAERLAKKFYKHKTTVE